MFLPMNKQFRVLVALDWRFRAVREITTGILDYASRKGNWDIRLYGNDPESDFSVLNHGWHPDGIFGNVDQIATKAAHTRIRAPHNVYFSTSIAPRRTKSARWVLADNAAIGMAAAKFFLKRQFSNFAFVDSTGGEPWSGERFSAFAKTLSNAGHKPHRYNPDESMVSGLYAERNALGKWIESLPLPCALFAACDARARHVIETCRFLHISIPEQIAVLGVDNDEILCELPNPSMSSIEPNFAEGGRMGANILDRMMLGEAYDIPQVSHYGVRQIVARLSTADLHGSRRTVTLASNYIRFHADDSNLSVSTVATALNCSSRYLQKCFKSVNGSSVLEEIHGVRLAHASKLLKKSRIPIQEIASLCGFSSGNTLKRLFKRVYGTTMRSYRGS